MQGARNVHGFGCATLREGVPLLRGAILPSKVIGPTRTTPRLAGATGLGYVLGASIENMEILEAPTLDSPVSELRAFYADQAFGVVTTAAGALSLVFYCVFAVLMFGLLRGAGEHDRAWRTLGLVGGLGGPLVAAVALGASAILVAEGASGLSEDTTRSLFELTQRARMASAVLALLFLLGYGVAALRSRALPASLAWTGLLLAPLFLIGPVAALTGDPALRLAVAIAFGLQSFWIFLTSLWLILADDAGNVAFLRRAAFLVLVLAAGLVGLGLLAAPGATGRFFSWNLEPEALAAFAGGVYVGSALVYAVALARPGPELRPLVAAAVVLSVSVLAASVAHADVFDFDRLQTWAWFVLFAGFGAITTALLALGSRDGADPGSAGPTPTWSRALLACLAVLLAALATALWIDPVGVGSSAPFELPPLGGRFAGAWVALLAVAAGWAAWSARAQHARLAALALVALPAGALIGALRTLPDLEPRGTAAVYITALVLLVVAGIGVLRALAGDGRDAPAGHG